MRLTLLMIFAVLISSSVGAVGMSTVDADAFIDSQIADNTPSFKLNNKYKKTFRSRSKSSNTTSSYCRGSRVEYRNVTLTILEQSGDRVKLNYSSDSCGRMYSSNYIGKFNDQYLLLRSSDSVVNTIKAFKISENGSQINNYLVFTKSGNSSQMDSRTNVDVVGKNWTIIKSTGFVGEVSASSIIGKGSSIWLRTDKPGTAISFDKNQATMCSWQDCNGTRKTCGVKIDGDYDSNNSVVFHIPTNSGETRPIAFTLSATTKDTMSVLLSGRNAGAYKSVGKSIGNIDQHCRSFF